MSLHYKEKIEDDFSISFLKTEDYASGIIKKEEYVASFDDIASEMDSHSRNVNHWFDQLLLNLEQYLEDFVNVEDFSLRRTLLNDAEAREMVAEAKTTFKENALEIINSLSKNLREKAIQHIVPDNFIVQVIETTKRRIFNSFRQLKKNLVESITNTDRQFDEETELPEKPKEKTRKKRGDFPPRARALLKAWFVAHAQDPYPSHEEKISLAREGGISMKQIENWLTNTRGRIWKKMQTEKHFGIEIESTLINNDSDLI